MASLAALVDELAGVRAERARLRTVEIDLELQIDDAMTGRFLRVGLFELERRRGANRKAWDHDGLLSVVLARSRDERICDQATGEYEDPGAAAVRVLAETAHIDYWRTQPLRARGVDVDEYCTTTPGTVFIDIRLREAAAS